MAGFTLEEWIARMPQPLFDLLSDASRASELAPAVKQMEKLTGGPVGVGTRYRETRVMKGKVHETELEVVRYEQPAVYAMRNVTNGIETVYEYRLVPEGEGTRIFLSATVQGSGLKKLMVPLVAGILKREDGDHLARLKQVAEQELKTTPVKNQ